MASIGFLVLKLCVGKVAERCIYAHRREIVSVLRSYARLSASQIRLVLLLNICQVTAILALYPTAGTEFTRNLVYTYKPS
jgi:hypothetical protein